MNIIFMGTPDIAADSLRKMLACNMNVIAVFTREDKPVGRKRILTAPPVKILAQQHGIPVYQPKTLRGEDTAKTIVGLQPDLIVVVAYGRILPLGVLQVPKYGCINLHVSLLPKYRGAAPIQWAVINGDDKTGVTIMRMDEGLDTGPILSQKEIDILPDETAGQVFEKVSSVGAEFLCEIIGDIQNSKAASTPQSGAFTLAPPLDKNMAEMDFAKPASAVHNLVRGCNPWPLAWFWFGGLKIKTVETAVAGVSGKQGEILSLKPLIVACGERAVELKRIVPQGAKEMDGAAWALGRRFKTGDFLC